MRRIQPEYGIVRRRTHDRPPERLLPEATPKRKLRTRVSNRWKGCPSLVSDTPAWPELVFVTLTKVKHRRELLFAALSCYSPLISLSRNSSGWDWMEFCRLPWAHDMGSAFMLYAQGPYLVDFDTSILG